MRKFTEIVSEGFIWGVGITRPAPGQEKRAALYITTTLFGSILAVIALFLLLLHTL
ncbi:hypothetical protein SAMN05421771_3347 [Granulicella pectinivorans]|jgi:hypothetical protein|uniref:Uncharacterized protein n=1 Tax=Granulicella pectinivorans TaxID=474950 RepID=A0A1I6MQW2_9BACT|nr:hypothetical protein [Granulicella pectinivorans]SFS18113.1 hypothetical protein SAMN05421771_3347 [Granulicella pectinivorans]